MLLELLIISYLKLACSKKLYRFSFFSLITPKKFNFMFSDSNSIQQQKSKSCPWFSHELAVGYLYSFKSTRSCKIPASHKNPYLHQTWRCSALRTWQCKHKGRWPARWKLYRRLHSLQRGSFFFILDQARLALVFLIVGPSFNNKSTTLP